jgi:hypothetical protein
MSDSEQSEHHAESGSSLVIDDVLFIRRLGYYKRTRVQRSNGYIKIDGVGHGVILDCQPVNEVKLTVRLKLKTAQGKKEYVVRCHRRDYFDNLLTRSSESSTSMSMDI